MKRVILQMLLIVGIPILSYILVDSSITRAVLNLIQLDISSFIAALENLSVSEKIISLLESIIIGVIILYVVRKYNGDKLFNRGNEYFNYPIIFFYIGSKILGFKKVSLVRIPLYLQFKLIINDVFEIFETDPNVEEKISGIFVRKDCNDSKATEINFILNDTYEVQKEGIPDELRTLPTVIISNGETFDGVRTYNIEFIKEVRKQTHKYSKEYLTLNIFPLTNTNHNKEIIESSFKNAGRTGFQNINVFKHNVNSDRFYEKIKVL